MKHFSIGKFCSLFWAAFFITIFVSTLAAKAQIQIPDFPYLSDVGDKPRVTYLPAQPVFGVQYYHPSNIPPQSVNLVVDGADYPLDPLVGEDGEYDNGEIFVFFAPTSTFARGSHSYHYETSDGIFSTRLPANGEYEFEIKNTPVIIIPGILGSEQKDGEWVIDPIFHTYDNLIATFEANGYTDGVDLFTFPYEWRQSNIISGFELKLKINNVKQLCGCNKVDLVAHSMGGLVARQYVESDNYQHDVDQLVFLGTPHLGAPKTYITWEGGASPPGSTTDGFIKFLLSTEALKNGYLSLFSYIRNAPIESIEELLPTYDYLVDSSDNSIRHYPIDYPVNLFLDDLNQNVEKLYNSGVIITNIVGSANGTITGFRVVPATPSLFDLWQHGYPDKFDSLLGDHGIDFGNGDGTVPRESSDYIKNNLVMVNSEHRMLVTNAEDKIINIFSGITKPILVNKISFPDLGYLIFKILSPADIVVVAPDGKRVGKDFNNGNELGEIDGAFYSGFQTDNEFITIPNPIDGVYTVLAQGTDNGGEYTIAGGYISNTSSADVNVVGHISPGQINSVKFEVQTTNQNPIEVQQADITPPEILISSPNSADYLRTDNLLIDVVVSDTESGISSQEIKFDGTIVNNKDLVDLFYQHLGDHNLSVSSTDLAGNFNDTSTSFRIVASTTSTIADVDRAASLGWITDKRLKKDLISDLKKIIRWESRINWLEEKLPGKPKILHKIEKLEKIIDRQLAKDVLRDLKNHLKKGINQQAYDILKEDVEWLINN